jgi:hypothetical protein
MGANISAFRDRVAGLELVLWTRGDPLEAKFANHRSTKLARYLFTSGIAVWAPSRKTLCSCGVNHAVCAERVGV